MAERINDGGPAFPAQQALSAVAYADSKIRNIDDPAERIRVYQEAHAQAISGMTLRDYFAAEALKPVYADAMVEYRHGSGRFDGPDWRIEIALDAYKMADAMLRAREGGAA